MRRLTGLEIAREVIEPRPWCRFDEIGRQQQAELRVDLRNYVCEGTGGQAVQRGACGTPLFQCRRYRSRKTIGDFAQLRAAAIQNLRKVLRRTRQRYVHRQEALAKRALGQGVGQ